MAEHNVNTVKTQIQSLIDLANETTGNQDTNLTDGVNALVSGYGQGGDLPTDTLVGLSNGYDVMFYDENNEGLSFYSIKQGHTINPPVYNCKAWQTSDGVNIVFPYTPTNDLIVYAINSTYASALYDFYNIDSVVYPYVVIQVTTSTPHIYVVFLKTLSYHSDGRIKVAKESVYASKFISSSNVANLEIETVVAKAMEVISANDLKSATSTFYLQTSDSYEYTNFENNSGTSNKYRLDV